MITTRKNLGWANDPKVYERIKALRAQGEVFHCVHTDVYGKDDVYEIYESESGKYVYHVCTE